MLERLAPPSSRCSGTPAAFAAMSQSARSRPESANAVMPKRPKMCRRFWIFKCTPAMSAASAPRARGAIMSRSAAATALRMDLARGRVEQVRATHDVGDALFRVVDDHGKLVGKLAVGAVKHKIAHIALEVLLLRALHAIFEGDTAPGTHTQGARLPA